MGKRRSAAACLWIGGSGAVEPETGSGWCVAWWSPRCADVWMGEGVARKDE